MIALEDCIGLCGLTEEEVLAIAEHESPQQHSLSTFYPMSAAAKKFGT